MQKIKKSKTKEKGSNENEYESMTAKELYNLCKERDIECKPKKAKEYYIDLLEEYDSDSDDDDWDEEEESDDWD